MSSLFQKVPDSKKLKVIKQVNKCQFRQRKKKRIHRGPWKVSKNKLTKLFKKGLIGRREQLDQSMILVDLDRH